MYKKQLYKKKGKYELENKATEYNGDFSVNNSKTAMM